MAKQKQQQKPQLINKDTIISEILTINPNKSALLTEMLMDFGIHCVGCGASTFETLGQGVLGHGYTEDQLTKLVEDLNKAINSDDSQTTSSNQTNEQTFNLTLTPFAISKVKEAMKQRGKANSTLKVSVLAGGCSGFMYDLQFMDNPSKEDLNFKQDKINIAVDKNNLDQLNGIQIDFVDTLNESGFKFENPNATQDCGCGKSLH
jgi:iron-sulfur cluster assembly accessory protein